MRKQTIGGFIERLQRYDPDTPCCGTFWLPDDFLQLDETLTLEEIAYAMKMADDRHDAGIGYNWDFFQYIVDEIIAERE
ncbi:hypothetical protein I5Q23_24625 [Serratia marcescens]|nr:hypothetical protein [Serratia marcescens]